MYDIDIVKDLRVVGELRQDETCRDTFENTWAVCSLVLNAADEIDRLLDEREYLLTCSTHEYTEWVLWNAEVEGEQSYPLNTPDKVNKAT